MRGRQAVRQARRVGAAFALAFLLIPDTAHAVGEEGKGTNPNPNPATAAPVVKLAKIEDFAPAEEFVMVGPVKTHFVRKGENGRPVVLVHGFGSSTYTWEKTLDALSGRYRVYALDMKGFGLTAKLKDGQYHPEALTRHLLGFLDVMKLDRPVLVGHSLGGTVVTRLTLLHPDRVSGLVLVAPAPLMLPRNRNAPGGIDQASKNDTASDTTPTPAARIILALLRKTITKQTVEAGLKAAFHDPSRVTPEMIDLYYRPILIEGTAEALAAMTNPPTTTEPPLPPLGGLNVPTLVAAGEHDRFVKGPAIDRYAQAIPGARKVVFHRSGHVPHEEEPDAFNVRLLEFLDQLPPKD